MPLITCPDCHKEISDLAKACPQCGRPMVEDEYEEEEYEEEPVYASRRKRSSPVISALQLFLFIGGMIGLVLNLLLAGVCFATLIILAVAAQGIKECSKCGHPLPSASTKMCRSCGAHFR